MSKPLMSLTATAIGLIVGAGVAHAALTATSCLAQKQKAWGWLRQCEAKEKAKLLEAKPGDLAKCQVGFSRKLGDISTKAAYASLPCRYGDNGDGTVTDYDTGLQWEQKTDDASVHDKGNTYQWSASSTAPDGNAFVGFLGTLNNGTSNGVASSGCFADHCDWRLPLLEELGGILDGTQGECGGGSGPCIDQSVFGPTVVYSYWSASTRPGVPDKAWDVYSGAPLGGANTFDDFKFRNDLYVRGVRSAL